MSNTNRITSAITVIADMTGKTLTPQLVMLYVSSLVKYSEPVVLRALTTIAKTATRFPTVAEILALIDQNEAPSRVQGERIAGDILHAISKFGWANTEKAKEHLGERAWSVVSQFGGWSTLCRDINSENKNMMYAQLRDLAASGATQRNIETHNQITHEEKKALLEKLNMQLG